MITVQVTDDDGSTGSTELTATVNDAALTGASGDPVAAVEGQPFQNVPVATFIDTNPLGTATDFTATIDWGDGTTAPGTLARSASARRVRAIRCSAATRTQGRRYSPSA